MKGYTLRAGIALSNPHVIKYRRKDAGVEYMLARDAQSTDGKDTGTPSSSFVPTPAQVHHTNMTRRVIRGTVGGVLVGIACATLLLYLYLRRKQRRSKRVQPDTEVSPLELPSPQQDHVGRPGPHAQTHEQEQPTPMSSVGQHAQTSMITQKANTMFGKELSPYVVSLPELTGGRSSVADVDTDFARPIALPPAYSERQMR